jgi:dihydroorotate dehydrogenase (fumarate)
MADLKTRYMGLELKNPFVVGSSKLTSNMETIKKLEEAGAGALVLASLFEEQIKIGADRLEDFVMGSDSREQSEISVFPGMSYAGPEEHLSWVRKAKKAVNIPVIGSLNAVTRATWKEWALRLADTGIDGLELNFYATPSDFDRPAASIEDEQVETLGEIRQSVGIPVSAKLSSAYTNPLNLIRRMDEAGADGFVLFNRFIQPDIDPVLKRRVFTFDLSESQENRLPLRFTALLHGRIKADIMATSGIHSGADALKLILAGACGVQVVSSLYRYGLDHLGKMTQEVSHWRDLNGSASLAEVRGILDKEHSDDPHAYERAQYVRILMRSDASVGGYQLY